MTRGLTVDTVPRTVAGARKTTGEELCHTRGAVSSPRVARETYPTLIRGWHIRHSKGGSLTGRLLARLLPELVVPGGIGTRSNVACRVAPLGYPVMGKEDASCTLSVFRAAEVRPRPHSTSTRRFQ